jgi:hypothetical protein
MLTQCGREFCQHVNIAEKYFIAKMVLVSWQAEAGLWRWGCKNYTPERDNAERHASPAGRALFIS